VTREVLGTARLAIVPFAPADVDVLLALHADPEVQRFLDPEGRPWPRSVIEAKIAGWMEDERRLGYAKWKVVRRDDGAFLGRAGFGVLNETGETELGFALAREHWGRGYATELATGLLVWVFAHTALDHVIAIVHERNAASRRVLEKAGMRQRERRVWHGMPFAFYATERP
jgi:RimJ/RimL family protein N-acetyltransferase